MALGEKRFTKIQIEQVTSVSQKQTQDFPSLKIVFSLLGLLLFVL